DGTQAICENYAKKDPRIICHRQEKNIGMFPNFKFLLDRANGDFFMWAGHDDLWEKDFIKICVKNLDNNKNIDISSTGIADVDSFGRTLRELNEFPSLSGKPGIISIIRYVLQPEVLGKCNIMYSLFRLPAIKKIWEIYPQRQEWGSDYHFSLAAISHFGIFIESRILSKRRHGGFSNPLSTINDKENIIRKIEIKNPKNHMFPFGRFNGYFNGHMKALDGTPYKTLATILLYSRLPRSFIIHVKERINNKFKKICLK
ncbi:glycosyltransferase, partial [Candidatus Parcubacteria bacterium]|nr:glycosyltransferase [Patescibacteria group bacterium]MCG2699186.1 glycosyltransferase [Candidatus Parcubacteria bacterium]